MNNEETERETINSYQYHYLSTYLLNCIATYDISFQLQFKGIELHMHWIRSKVLEMESHLTELKLNIILSGKYTSQFGSNYMCGM